MSEPLLAPTFLFRFSAPLAYRDPLWPVKGTALDDGCRLLPFGKMDGRKLYADVRAAWSEAGLAFSVRVEGKRQPVWCREARMDDSDKIRCHVTNAAFRRVLRRSGYFVVKSGIDLTVKVNAVPVPKGFYDSADEWHFTLGDGELDH